MPLIALSNFYDGFSGCSEPSGVQVNLGPKFWMEPKENCKPICQALTPVEFQLYETCFTDALLAEPSVLSTMPPFSAMGRQQDLMAPVEALCRSGRADLINSMSFATLCTSVNKVTMLQLLGGTVDEAYTNIYPQCDISLQGMEIMKTDNVVNWYLRYDTEEKKKCWRESGRSRKPRQRHIFRAGINGRAIANATTDSRWGAREHCLIDHIR